jgi:cytochrome c oxidase subunit 3
LTVILGAIFLFLQAEEYMHAYSEMGLTLASGIYGSTFFMLTGFHGFHVTMGATMLTVILIRSIKGHFTPDNHFAFEAVAWYWHFVDVVWLGLFIFVYWL